MRRLNMNMEWHVFYRESADKLLGFRNNRQDLLQIIKDIFQKINLPLPTLEKDNHLTDIDPFTVLGLFNKHQTKSNRLKIITCFAEQLHISSKIPSDFDGIPLLNNLNATFYCFDYERGEHDIDDLWSLFESALKYADDQNEDNKKAFTKYFDIVVNRKGNGTSKITMGLFWIAPDTFLNLDQRSEWYIYDSGKLPAAFSASLPESSSKISAAHYLEINDKVKEFLSTGESRIKNFPELSMEAWRYSEEVNQEKKNGNSQGDLFRDSQDDDAGNTGDSALDENVRQVHYWMYAPGKNAECWDSFYQQGIMAIGWGQIGDLKTFDSKEDMREKIQECYDPTSSCKNSALATWQFANEIQPGDIIFAKKGRSQLVGRGIVTSDYIFDENAPNDYNHIRKVNWTHCGEWDYPGNIITKTLTDITPYTGYVNKLNSFFETEEDDSVETGNIQYPDYSEQDFLRDVFISEQEFQTLKDLLLNKKNIILQGAPGVGKTYIARRLAYAMIGSKNKERVEMIQFHQNYSYEDFIMGFRPAANGFELRHGVFYNFCKKAETDPDNKYFFIIDEINRGNISKIFGELFMLIENDKRGIELQLLYSDERFSIPANLYLIGMMNTADRSLAMIDYALRRRFSFFTVNPGFDSDIFAQYQADVNSPILDRLIDQLTRLNDEISADRSLGPGFRIGHSYLCNLKSADDIAARLKCIVDYDIVPMLSEYWFDEQEKFSRWKEKLGGVFHDAR